MTKISIIGAGGIAGKHAKALGKIKDVEIVSVCDVAEEKASKLAAECGCPYDTDSRTSIERADLVYILTPPSFHKELAITAMRSGKHVMIEKPVSISVQDAEAIVEASRRYDRRTFVGFNMRFRTGYRKLEEFCRTGKPGNVMHLWSQRMGMNRPRNNWRTDPNLLSGFTIESLSHDIDMFRWISGGAKVESVYGQVQNSQDDLPGYDDNALVVLNLDNGTSAAIQASWSAHLEMNSRGVVGTGGTAMISGRGTWNFDTFRYRTQDMEHEHAEFFDDPLDAQSYEEENRHFLDCLKTGKPSELTAEYGLEILKTSHAILQSARENKLVTVT